jgi:predicted kinase
MPRLIMLKGLPASGKTTWAKEFIACGPKNSAKRVNKDDLRDMLDNGEWSKGNEEMVLAIRNYIIMKALANGKHVVVDDTNLAPKHEENLRKLAEDFGATFEIKDFTHVPVAECIKRDAVRANSVGKEVIVDVYHRFISKNKPVKNQPLRPIDASKPFCIVCDIDGTLARMESRHWTEFEKCGEDAVQVFVADILRTYNRDSMNESNSYSAEIILMSGRENKYREITEEWLDEHGIPYNFLVMRPTGDHRKDYIVKKELFEQHIEPEYNVLFALDDRNQVVDMWRNELHIPCLQVYYGDF